ncbi:hypothetical protein ACFXO7_37395, partial [Nocardia tengchongensis]
MPEFTALSPGALLELIAERAAALPGYAVVGLDGADAAEPLTVARGPAERQRARRRPPALCYCPAVGRPADGREHTER